MAYPNYGYGAYGYAYNPATAMAAPVDNDGAYNPRYHYAAAQNAGFELINQEEGGQPKTLYVGNLDASVTEEFICTLFSQIGVVTKTKVIFDALQAMNRRMLLNKEMKVNWATQPGTTQKVDTSKHFHVFVGDLSPEVDQKTLQDAFAPFGAISDVKVIRDPTTQKSKGYGFVSYPRREEAERAIEQMNGQWLGRRTIRTNWATRKPTDGAGSTGQSYNRPSMEEVMNQTTRDNTSVYVGNMPTSATEDEIRKTFGRFGNITDIRHFKAQGYSFVKFDLKESAARAIIEMNGSEMMGQFIKCSWGKSNDARAAAGDPGAGGFPLGIAGAYDPTTANQFYQYYQYYYAQQQAQQGANQQ